jgi:hypothetical protein
MDPVKLIFFKSRKRGMMVTIGGTILKEIIQDASLSILLEGKRAIG